MNVFGQKRPEQDQKVMTKSDLLRRIMAISRTLKTTKAMREDVLAHWASSPEHASLLNESELWMITAIDNRIVGLMQEATATAQSLASHAHQQAS